VNPVDRVVGAYRAAIDRYRARSASFDHIWQARERYSSMFGARLAAAIAYYGFFAAFAVGLLAYSVLGYLLGGHPAVLSAVDGYLQRNLPFLNSGAIRAARNTVAAAGLLGLLFAGVGWIDNMRSAQRAMWGLVQQPGNVVVRWLVDLGTLVGLGVLLNLSLWASSGIHDLLHLLLRLAHVPGGAISVVLRWVGETLAVGVNLLMSAGLLIGVPRLWVGRQRIIGPTILVGVGLTLLTTIGRVYIGHTESNPAYQVAGAAVGLLVFLYLFSQLLLFGAAVAATSPRGRVRDLAAPPARPPVPAGELAD
jgi:membrane protein